MMLSLVFSIFPNSWKRLKIGTFLPVLSDCEDCFSDRVYVMGRGPDIHYETILLQFNRWKPFLQACVRVKIAKFSEVTLLPPRYFLQQTAVVC